MPATSHPAVRLSQKYGETVQFRRFVECIDILCRMRITIATRLFLALTLVSLVILTLNAVITRWNFERGFLEYVAEQESDTISAAASDLAELYRIDGSWGSLQGNPRRWSEVLRPDDRSARPDMRPPPRHQPDRPPPGQQPGGGPPHDPLEFGRRISLLDADSNVIVGATLRGEDDRSVPILVDGQTVGFVSIAPQQQLTNQLDQSFARKQERSIYLIAIAALLFAAVISAILARQLTQPIRALASGARSITRGHYDTRIEAAHGDELGDLAGDFNQLAETLEKNRLSRQRWVADIAHELRTPLAILRGELDAVEDGVRIFDTTTRKSLQAEVARLNKLVGDLHDLSVYDEDVSDYQIERFDIGALLRGVLDNAENRLHDASIELTRQLPTEPLEVLADATRLEQLFANLLENTLRYTDTPGTLHVSCSVDSDNVELLFADSAPGVPEGLLGQLFDRLFRVNESRNRNSGGSGLGLSICKAIVDAHGGTIQASNSDTDGLLIRVRLPLARAAEPES
jgi:two-component system sensor histidine kinase BaeS